MSLPYRAWKIGPVQLPFVAAGVVIAGVVAADQLQKLFPVLV